jgi:putative ABC transport system permease protein
MFDTWLQDARYALRLLRKSPLFTATAALSLAIGIGADTTIFSVANALLLRPLPGLADHTRLVDVGRTQNGSGFDTVSYPNYVDFKARTTTLEDVYAYRPEPQPLSLGGRGDAERIYGTLVTGNYFTILGTRAAAGRLLTPADDTLSGPHDVVVLSHDFWRRRFASDPSIVGQTLTLNGTAFGVVGIAPPGFRGTTILKPDVWIPLSSIAEASPRLNTRLFSERRSVWLVLGARLKPGVTGAQANAELFSIGTALEREFPEANRGKNFLTAPMAVVPGYVNTVAMFLGLLMVIVGLVLLIACANVAGMLLARAAARRREIAVRLAIGAGRGRLIRQLLTETVVLFAAGAALGLLLTRALTSLLISILPPLPFPIALDVPTDWRVVGFALALSFVAAVLSGLAPALQASRSDLVPALKADGLDGGPSRLRLRNAFVIGQVTLALVLVIAAGLFLRALQQASHIDPGFDQNKVDVVALDLSLGGYADATGRAFLRDLLERARTLPGIESVTAAADLPLDGDRMGFGGITVPGVQPPNGQTAFGPDWNTVEPGHFTTLRMRLVRGRDFTDADTATAPGVAIINEAFAKQLWPGQDPIGRQMMTDDDGPRKRPLQVVGLTADARLVSLGTPAEPFIYVPFAQQYVSRVAVLVRTTDGHNSVPQIRDAIRGLNPNLPIIESLPLTQVTAIGLVPQRIAAAVAGSLGIVGLLLAAIGIYGVTAYAVSRRTREIGIRIALGADRSAVIRLVLQQGLLLASIGVTIGVAIAAVGSRLVESLLFGVRGLDPVTFGVACVLFAAVTLVASYVPARRASTVDPMVALRNE